MLKYVNNENHSEPYKFIHTWLLPIYQHWTTITQRVLMTFRLLVLILESFAFLSETPLFYVTWKWRANGYRCIRQLSAHVIQFVCIGYTLKLWLSWTFTKDKHHFTPKAVIIQKIMIMMKVTVTNVSVVFVLNTNFTFRISFIDITAHKCHVREADGAAQTLIHIHMTWRRLPPSADTSWPRRELEHANVKFDT